MISSIPSAHLLKKNLAWMKLSIFVLACAALFFSSVDAVLAASEHAGGHGAHATHDEETLESLIPFWVNFVIYLALMSYLLKKPIVNGWGSRRVTIQQSIAAAARVYESAHAKFVSSQSRYALLPGDIQKLTQEVRSEIERECAGIIKESQVQSGRITQQARDTVLAEQNVQRATTRKNFIEKVMSEAEARARSLVTAESDVGLRAAAVSKAQRAIARN